MKNIEVKLKEIVSSYYDIQKKLSSPDISNDERISFSKKLSSLEQIIEKKDLIERIEKTILETKDLLQENLEKELMVMAKKDIEDSERQLSAEKKEIQRLLVPSDIDDEKNAILEIRAGTGGDEAALFSMVLLRMYQKFAEIKKWKYEILGFSETNIGGCKEAILSFSGERVFSTLKFESGVHRVQRVPQTETQGRIHTSAATVAVLPLADEIDVNIDPKDLRIDTFRSQGAGGQHVNTTDSAVRITHLPTNIVASCQDEKSQHKNKAKAMKILISRLYEKQKNEKDAAMANKRKSMIGSGDRSEKIRSYNYPQGRITDHRINFTIYKLEDVLSGISLEEIINPLKQADLEERLKDLL
tara:strand:- start:3629 stop:4702 length:1074 start_codon:yes stop_codon:yes gene_type:complete